jgi:hypothetical protein
MTYGRRSSCVVEQATIARREEQIVSLEAKQSSRA